MQQLVVRRLETEKWFGCLPIHCHNSFELLYVLDNSVFVPNILRRLDQFRKGELFLSIPPPSFLRKAWTNTGRRGSGGVSNSSVRFVAGV